MLDLALIRAEPARVKAAMARRGVGPEAVDAVVELDGRWTARREVREALRIRRRQISDEVARRKATLRTGPDWDADTFHAPDRPRGRPGTSRGRNRDGRPVGPP